MKASINQQWLQQTSFDSSAPSGSAAVLHRFQAHGEYSVRFVQDTATLAHVRLAVAPDVPGKAAAPEHITLDLNQIEYPGTKGSTVQQGDHVLVRPDGYVSFTFSGKSKPFAVVAEATSADKGGGFDSRRLGPGDIFAVTLVRPGDYRVANEIGKYEGRITVAYPVVGDRPYRPPEPISVDCTGSGFQPKAIDLLPAQGLIFRVQAPSRITIELTRPDDGPKDRPKPKVGISREALLKAMDRLRESRKKR